MTDCKFCLFYIRLSYFNNNLKILHMTQWVQMTSFFYLFTWFNYIQEKLKTTKINVNFSLRAHWCPQDCCKPKIKMLAQDNFCSSMNSTTKWQNGRHCCHGSHSGVGGRMSPGHGEERWGHPVCASSLPAFSTDLHEHHLTARWETHLKPEQVESDSIL